MFISFLVKFFGNIWHLKKACLSCRNPLVKKVLLLIYKWYQYQNGSGIAWNSVFKGEPCTPHGIKGIFISGEAVIGKNCVIFQQVTIGSNTLPDSKGFGAPRIGDNCYISAGAKIIGRVIVGDNVRIGANAVVHKDIPENSVVVTGEQRIIARDEAMDNHFYSYKKKWCYFDRGKWITVTDQAALKELYSKFPRALNR